MTRLPISLNAACRVARELVSTSLWFGLGVLGRSPPPAHASSDPVVGERDGR